jgi:hypothetical protein
MEAFSLAIVSIREESGDLRSTACAARQMRDRVASISISILAIVERISW